MDKETAQHWDTYVQEVKPILDGANLQGKVLLDIAPGECCYYKLFSGAGLDKYIAVDPNHQWLDTAKLRLEYVNAAKEYNFFYNTYEDYKCSDHVDVVYSCGLLYHLSNPFHFLEYVANQNAEYVILEHTGHLFDPTLGPIWTTDEMMSIRHYGGVTNEPTNMPGMRLTNAFKHMEPDRENRTDRKFIPLNVFISCDLVVWCMDKMGYELEDYSNLATGERSKDQNCAMRFKEKRN